MRAATLHVWPTRSIFQPLLFPLLVMRQTAFYVHMCGSFICRGRQCTRSIAICFKTSGVFADKPGSDFMWEMVGLQVVRKPEEGDFIGHLRAEGLMEMARIFQVSSVPAKVSPCTPG